MNDTIPQERFFQRTGSILRRRIFPLRPTSIFLREIAVAMPVFLSFLLLLVISCLLAVGGFGENFERSWARGWTTFWSLIWIELGSLAVFSLGVAAGSSIPRYGRMEFIRALPISENRIVLEKWLGSLLVLAAWILANRYLRITTIWFHGGHDFARSGADGGPFWKFWVLCVHALWPWGVALVVGAWFGRRPLFAVAISYVLFQLLNFIVVSGVKEILLAPTFQDVPGWVYLSTQLAIGLFALALFAHRYRTCEAMPS